MRTLSFSFIVLLVSLAGAEIVVDPNGSYDHTTIQAAINAAGPGDIITVRPGTYVENINMKGKAVTLRSTDPTNPVVAAATIIDGGGISSTVNCFLGETSTTVISGFTIRNGSYDDGGGMWNISTSPTVSYCIFSGNTATVDGGGMYNENASPTVTNCTFSGNTANVNGGGMYNENASPTVTDCTFIGNDADYGGGMFNNNSSPTLDGCTFTDNTAVNNGGGMSNKLASSTTIDNSTFSGNIADNFGGGIYVNSESDLRADYCTFTSNAAYRGGGIHVNDHSTNRIRHCTLTENRASDGGAVYNYDYSYTSYNDCLITKNSPTQLFGSSNDNGGNTIADPIWYVDDDLPASFAAVQDAVTASANGDTIVVMPGTYVENIDMDGRAVTLRSTDPTDGAVVASTKLNGGMTGSVITCNSGEGADTVIEGLTIYNGSGTVLSGKNYGAGFYNVNSSPTINDCIIRNNVARIGGGMYNDDASPLVSNCIFDTNDAITAGGGIYNDDYSSPKISYCTFNGNYAFNGGGMYNRDNPTITDCTFSHNESPDGGAGVYNESWPVMNRCNFCRNDPDNVTGNFHGSYRANNTLNCVFVDGDSDGDGDVDMTDFYLLAENWLVGT